jgi:prepilin-type N-terminal cleavage/methylation domain-containing protein/prepilin-type processing-associated H-X9-DG protein
LRRTRGFTLIELLVVIAIIGILAGMVFPVFARARESARKAVCLSNVKNIALAFQMYLADNNDTFPPSEHRQEVIDYFQGNPGGGDKWTDPDETCHMSIYHANPYLRFPVVLDEYVKNREVWQCPSMKMFSGAQFIYGIQDWWNYLRDNEGLWGDGILCLDGAYPRGWGGQVTDSIAQNMLAYQWDPTSRAAAHKSFIQGIGVNQILDVKMVEIDDPVNHVVCGDSGAFAEWMCPGLLAFPDICAIECGNCWGWADWEICTWAEDCGLFNIAPNNGSLLRNPHLRKPYTRHLGGINIGWADGHASWMNSEAFMDKFAEDCHGTGWPYGLGMWAWGPYSWWYCGWGTNFAENSGGEPTLR